MKISPLHVAYPLILSIQSCVHWHSGNARYKLLKAEISFHRKPAFEMASAKDKICFSPTFLGCGPDLAER